MRILKLLFSRLPILALAVLLQAAVLFTVGIYYSQYFLWVQIVSIALALTAFLHMLNRDTPPEFKLPWMLILIVFPLFGVVLYLFLANPKIRKRQDRVLRALEEQRDRYLGTGTEQREAIAARLGDHAGIEPLLAATAYSDGFLGGDVTYYGDGTDFFSALTEALEGARHFIFLEYFVIEPGKTWDRIHGILCQKRREGVEVRILYDDFGTLGKLSGGYCKHLESEGLRARRFNPVRPILSGIFNYRDHRKIAVVDGHIAFTGGMNIGDAYAGLERPFGVWKDAGLRIEGAAVGNLTLLFLQLWATAGRGDTDVTPYFPSLPAPKGEGYVHPFGAGPMPFYPEAVAENALLALIGTARRTLYITTPYLIVNRTVQTALKNAALRGVDVRIVTPHIPDKRLVFQLTRASYRPLLAAGVQIFEYTPGFLHAKQILVDGELALVGSINLDYRSLSHHFECGALLAGTPAIGAIAEDFRALFSVSQRITREGFHMNPVGRLAAAFLTLFSPLF